MPVIVRIELFGGDVSDVYVDAAAPVEVYVLDLQSAHDAARLRLLHPEAWTGLERANMMQLDPALRKYSRRKIDV
jgi:hypothetical protein